MLSNIILILGKLENCLDFGLDFGLFKTTDWLSTVTNSMSEISVFLPFADYYFEVSFKLES